MTKLLLWSTICLLSCFSVQCNTLRRDVDALRELYENVGLFDCSDYSASWFQGNDENPCGNPADPWLGITCEKTYTNGSMGITAIEIRGSDACTPTGGFRDEIGKFEDLEALTVRDSLCNTPFPPSFAALKNLRFLDLSHSFMSGPIPPFLGSFSGMRTLLLQGNNWQGSIPKELGSLTQLVALNLAGLHFNLATGDITYLGMLSGTIPPELGQLIHLQFLDLSFNKLQGPIPPSFKNLTLRPIGTLALNDNAFSGPLPAYLSIIPRVNVTNNHFCSPKIGANCPRKPLSPGAIFGVIIACIVIVTLAIMAFLLIRQQQLPQLMRYQKQGFDMNGTDSLEGVRTTHTWVKRVEHQDSWWKGLIPESLSRNILGQQQHHLHQPIPASQRIAIRGFGNEF